MLCFGINFADMYVCFATKVEMNFDAAIESAEILLMPVDSKHFCDTSCMFAAHDAPCLKKRTSLKVEVSGRLTFITGSSGRGLNKHSSTQLSCHL